jgi:hypothetical protein
LVLPLKYIDDFSFFGSELEEKNSGGQRKGRNYVK